MFELRIDALHHAPESAVCLWLKVMTTFGSLYRHASPWSSSGWLPDKCDGITKPTGRPALAVCTVYEPNFPDPQVHRLTTTALNLFNDCIVREAAIRGLPVLDLRLICTKPEDYANEIEPGVPGGKKIAAGILNLFQRHDFSSHRTAIYQ